MICIYIAGLVISSCTIIYIICVCVCKGALEMNSEQYSTRGCRSTEGQNVLALHVALNMLLCDS